MKVKQLKINAFRGIKELTLNFDLHEPTVIIGVNGAGKSSILDCLTILLSWLNNCIRSGKAYKQGYDFDSLDIKNDDSITKNTVTIYTNIQENKYLSWTLEKSRNTYLAKENRISKEVEKLLNRVLNFQGIKRQLPIVIYYSAKRFVNHISLVNKDNLFDTITAYDLALDNKNTNFQDFFEWFRNREDLENENFIHNPDKGKDRQLEAVRQAIYSILDNFSDLRVERYPLQMTLEKNGEKLIVNQLSDGEKGLLAMVGDIARRLAMVSAEGTNALEGEAIILIDQIELHLHPKWQREIITALKQTFPNCQFIITTHSPQVLSNIKPENIYVLESGAEGITARHPQRSFGRDSNSILEDVMGVAERPVEIKEDLQELFRVIEAGDLEAARELRQTIAEKIGSDEPELIKAATSIRRKEILDR